jgi:phage FluMu gp28-like protein
MDRRLPAVLLPYQQRLVAAIEPRRSVVVVEKSRRTGYSWTAAAIAALTAAKSTDAGGMDVLYMGYEKEMTREFIGYVADWARAFNIACEAVQEVVWTNPDRPEEDIKAFRISFASGFEVLALPSVARNLRGKQGLAILDEVAFMDDFPGVMKAALAYLMWGGKVLVLSTHLGEDNPFNQLVQDIRSGKESYDLQRCTFDEAMAEGLYERICLRNGEPATPEGKEAFRTDILKKYRDNADEELNCIPASGGGVPIPSSLVRARIAPGVPTLRWKRDKAWALLSEETRRAECAAWLRDVLGPYLARLSRERPYAVGMDFALVQDLSVIWPLRIDQDTSLRTPFVIELRTIPYEQQKTILFTMLDAMARKRSVAIDAGGSGIVLAQETAQRYGSLVQQVTLSEPWYREHMPPMKRAFEEGTIDAPQDEDTIGDFPLLRMVRGVIRVPPQRQQGNDGGKRHGDAAIACALACFASRAEPEVFGYMPVLAGPRGGGRGGGAPDDREDLVRARGTLRGRVLA